MTKQDLINRSLTEIDKLKNDTVVGDSELNFYEEFVSKYSPFSIESIKNMNYRDYFKAAINISMKDIPFSKIDEDMDKFGELLNKKSVEDIVMLTDVLKTITEGKMDDKIINSLKDKNTRRGIRSLTELFKKNEDSLSSNYFEGAVKDDETNGIIPLLEYNKKNPTLIIGIIGSVVAMKLLIENDESIKQQLEVANRNGFKIKEKEKNRQLDKIYKNAFLTDELRGCFANINNHCSELEKKVKREERDKSRKIRAYEDFINSLTKMFNNDEITNYESIIKKIPNDEIKIDFLKLVYQHNKVFYEDLNSTYEELSKNSTIHFLALLKKYNISKDEIDLSKVMRNKYDDVEESLSILAFMGFDKDIIIKAIQISNLDTINYLKMLRARGVISNEGFRLYPDLFDPNSAIFYTLNQNIKTLGKYKINPAVFVNNINVLLECNLENKLSILEEYNLIKSMKNNGDYSYLIKENLVSLIDKIIELGYENFLVGDLTLLNEDNWDRIYLLKSIGEEVTSKADLLAVLRDNSFMVSNSKIDKYISNIVPYYDFKDDVDITTLNNFKGTERTYNINGVIVSKNRFIRNCKKNKNDSVLKNLVYGGIYSKEEIESMIKSLKESKQK